MQLTDDVKGRSYLFDNYKALLIFLVVTGHMIDPAYGNTSAIDFVKWYIFAFHMPAFLFITGFFSKRKKAMGTLIQKFLVPYVIFQTLYYLEYTYVIGTSPDLALWIPKFSLWYLLSVFVYKAITPYVMKIPYPVAMVITVALGLVIGFWPFADNLLSIPRIVYFYPFYLTGVYLNMDTVHKLRRKGGANCIGDICNSLYNLFSLRQVASYHGRQGSSGKIRVRLSPSGSFRGHGYKAWLLCRGNGSHLCRYAADI